MRLASVRDIAPIKFGKIGEEYSPEISRYFGGLRTIEAEDRTSARYVLTSQVDDALRDRWRGFEAQYRSRARLLRMWVGEIADAVVHPPHGIVQVGDTLVRETIRDGKSLAKTFGSLKPKQADELVKLGNDEEFSVPNLSGIGLEKDEAFSLGCGMATNYFNWTLRYLSKVSQWQRGGRHLEMLTPHFSHSFIPDSLGFLGVPAGTLLECSVPTRVKSLTLTSPSAHGRYEISPLIVPALRSHPMVDLLLGLEPRPVYVMRGNARLRSVVNEAALAHALSERGYLIVDAGRLPIWQQVQVFRAAPIVVSPHGAGLTNIVYCRPGTRVIELIPEGYDQGVTSYRSLSDLFGLDYTAVFSREARPDRRGNPCNSDIDAPIEAITSLLDGSLTAERL